MVLSGHFLKTCLIFHFIMILIFIRSLGHLLATHVVFVFGWIYDLQINIISASYHIGKSMDTRLKSLHIISNSLTNSDLDSIGYLFRLLFSLYCMTPIYLYVRRLIKHYYYYYYLGLADTTASLQIQMKNMPIIDQETIRNATIDRCCSVNSTRKPTKWWCSTKSDKIHPRVTVVYNACYHLFRKRLCRQMHLLANPLAPPLPFWGLKKQK